MNFSISKNWNDATCDEFINELNEYLIWFKTKRIKKVKLFISTAVYDRLPKIIVQKNVRIPQMAFLYWHYHYHIKNEILRKLNFE